MMSLTFIPLWLVAVPYSIGLALRFACIESAAVSSTQGLTKESIQLCFQPLREVSQVVGHDKTSENVDAGLLYKASLMLIMRPVNVLPLVPMKKSLMAPACCSTASFDNASLHWSTKRDEQPCVDLGNRRRILFLSLRFASVIISNLLIRTPVSPWRAASICPKWLSNFAPFSYFVQSALRMCATRIGDAGSLFGFTCDKRAMAAFLTHCLYGSRTP
mmetsp:Transcript_35990/g.89738  ORF Transcript_35990/g.89738 Transcript_35990/m.89738 type:complete len:217 (-) Transcript_35990:931-1581(-)